MRQKHGVTESELNVFRPYHFKPWNQTFLLHSSQLLRVFIETKGDSLIYKGCEFEEI